MPSFPIPNFPGGRNFTRYTPSGILLTLLRTRTLGNDTARCWIEIRHPNVILDILLLLGSVVTRAREKVLPEEISAAHTCTHHHTEELPDSASFPRDHHWHFRCSDLFNQIASSLRVALMRKYHSVPPISPLL